MIIPITISKTRQGWDLNPRIRGNEQSFSNSRHTLLGDPDEFLSSKL